MARVVALWHITLNGQLISAEVSGTWQLKYWQLQSHMKVILTYRLLYFTLNVVKLLWYYLELFPVTQGYFSLLID